MHPVCLISRQHLKQFLQKATKRLMPEYFVLKYSIIEERNWSNLVFYPYVIFIVTAAMLYSAWP